MINIVRDSINKSLFLNPTQKQSFRSGGKKKIASFSFVDPIRHGEFLHDYFMTFALIHQHSLGCFSILFMNATVGRQCVLCVTVYAFNKAHLSVLTVDAYVQYVPAQTSCTFIAWHTK